MGGIPAPPCPCSSSATPAHIFKALEHFTTMQGSWRNPCGQVEESPLLAMHADCEAWTLKCSVKGFEPPGSSNSLPTQLTPSQMAPRFYASACCNDVHQSSQLRCSMPALTRDTRQYVKFHHKKSSSGQNASF
eukprot:1137035-Pelagomonas_calceolata.AAC.1